MFFKGDDGLTGRLGSGQRSNVYGKDPARNILDPTKCPGAVASGNNRLRKKLLEKSRYAGYKVLVQYSSGSRHVTDM